MRRVQNIPNEMESSAKEKKRRDQSVTESQKKVQKFLHGNVTSSSKNPQASDDSPVSIEKIRKDVEVPQTIIVWLCEGKDSY